MSSPFQIKFSNSSNVTCNGPITINYHAPFDKSISIQDLVNIPVTFDGRLTINGPVTINYSVASEGSVAYKTAVTHTILPPTSTPAPKKEIRASQCADKKTRVASKLPNRRGENHRLQERGPRGRWVSARGSKPKRNADDDEWLPSSSSSSSSYYSYRR